MENTSSQPQIEESDEKNIFDLINKKIQYIIDGYDIVDREADGCDEYGHLYWVDCKNGWGGREHDISSVMKESIYSYLHDFCNSVQSLNCKNIYIDDVLCLYRNGIFGLDNISIISEEEYMANNNVRDKLSEIKKKFLLYKESHEYWQQYKYKFEYLLCSNVNNFIKSLKEVISVDLIISILKNKEILKLTDDEFEFLDINTHFPSTIEVPNNWTDIF